MSSEREMNEGKKKRISDLENKISKLTASSGDETLKLRDMKTRLGNLRKQVRTAGRVVSDDDINQLEEDYKRFLSGKSQSGGRKKYKKRKSKRKKSKKRKSKQKKTKRRKRY